MLMQVGKVQLQMLEYYKMHYLMVFIFQMANII